MRRLLPIFAAASLVVAMSAPVSANQDGAYHGGGLVASTEWTEGTTLYRVQAAIWSSHVVGTQGGPQQFGELVVSIQNSEAGEICFSVMPLAAGEYRWSMGNASVHAITPTCGEVNVSWTVTEVIAGGSETWYGDETCAASATHFVGTGLQGSALATGNIGDHPFDGTEGRIVRGLNKWTTCIDG